MRRIISILNGRVRLPCLCFRLGFSLSSLAQAVQDLRNQVAKHERFTAKRVAALEYAVADLQAQLQQAQRQAQPQPSNPSRGSAGMRFGQQQQRRRRRVLAVGPGARDVGVMVPEGDEGGAGGRPGPVGIAAASARLRGGARGTDSAA
jgi:hypothetical protein